MMRTAAIQWLKSGEPFSERFQDFYFSTDGGLDESEYIFIKQNNFPQCCIQSTYRGSNKPFKIAETGFGTGLNFLVSLFYYMQSKEKKPSFEYISVEKYPLTKSQLKKIYSIFNKNWPQLSPYSAELLTAYPASFSDSDSQSFHLNLLNGKVKLNLIINDAASGLKQLLPHYSETIDIWYLDGFSPAKNPDMWQQELFESIAKLSKSGATLSTFTSAGFVRRGLETAGFNITKVPGLGKKREILTGIRQ
ncbi:MAG: tRNA (5-methylaminomethyl-2-thiouridine)(34)-methyltransferase MnmD [gamma proteobacterium symbiont of Taylorina sp.]|nr:tRNA (5-methylaminomethyl-2-thiouridine)(34)-methyltransferase MnmD [gamma proteobacterium symbiont of Taylorina sp.]